ncbi:hypothetical protein TDMWS_05070 [Thermodesulfomicrobium sp. WS]|uniref:hypothetical protein n=1 Tax=Thermodesulfomicrobium sp. WS TaxID=3004129 RepID=UPI0024926259|nr:hypothetical protein [Thermodesulfomicrobium sp. WS]BDV00422.1 hypothetical protein TDMWS_05070 [Thermodesulfomicrobium sp. WS]
MPGNLDSLDFDLADGVASFAIPPHPGIWGRHAQGPTLDRILAAAPPAFSRLLVACHLLWPQHRPAWARPHIAALARGLWDVPLDVLEHAPWRLALVPTAGPEGAVLAHVLVGFGPLPEAKTAALWSDTAARHAAVTVTQVVAQRRGRTPCLLPLAPHERLVGASLALPCALAALAALDDLALPEDVIATGGLDLQGHVLPVAEVATKAQCPGRLFLYPQGCAAPPCPHAVAVTTLDEAWAILRWARSPEAAAKLLVTQRLLESALSQPGSGALAAELATLPGALAPWVRHQRHEITRALCRAPDLNRLVDALPKLPENLQEALLACMNATVADHQPQAAWKLAMLQMERANHRGDVTAFAAWKTIALQHESAVPYQEDGPQSIVLHAVIKAIGERHNRYDFPPALPLNPHEREALEELESVWERRRQRFGPCPCIILGQYYGTLGQHYGFLGPAYLPQCIALLRKAEEAFCAPRTGRWDDIERDQLYAIMAWTSAGEHAQAAAELNALIQRRGTVAALNAYELHALLRVSGDARLPLAPDVTAAIRKRVDQDGEARHPWQLVAVNLARHLAHEDPQAARALAQRSAQWCARMGPTVQVMALLPLALLQSLGVCIPEEPVAQALAPVRSELLHPPHFAPLLDLDAPAVLDLVARQPARFFPYTYH